MATLPQDSSMEGVPGTPGIREVRPESSSEDFKFCTVSSRDSNPGIRRVGLRAEIDTSPPFESVKEAVTRFGGSGPWVPLFKFGEAYHGIEEFDIKKVEEQAAELEKDLIVKELETLDVLEELGTTKRIVEDLKKQLKDEALKCMTKTPHLNPDEHMSTVNNEHHEHVRIGSSRPYHRRRPVSSPDSVLMELKQAKLNLGETINDLGNTVDPSTTTEGPRAVSVLETTGEMRWFAAKKMEEAAMAAEALALVELNALAGTKGSSGFSFPEPESKPEQSPRTPKVLQKAAEEVSNREMIHSMHEFDEANNISQLTILRKLEEASNAMKKSKKALEEALKSVEIANKKQLDAEESLRKWNKQVVYNGSNINNLQRSPLKDVMMNKQNPKPVPRPTVSMRDMLKKANEGQNEGQKVALSQMLDELKQDLRFHPKTAAGDHDKKHHGDDHRKQVFTQRRRFGFIHISLPLSKQSKKKPQALNTM
ncbi:hypothetical protein Gogos_005177 [Gossypium gossypioides]|uniref:WEB family protein At2g40480-like n=1 Tax=Gossypium gossypioides TaxID=34282 RepID=A0A7J9CJ17_GOSGO|nr:hypothetical protein [Gossypium gossypioides]